MGVDLMGRIGLWMLAAGALAAAVEVALMMPLALRVRRRARELAALLESEAAWFDAWSAEAAVLRADRLVLLGPVRRVARILRHPLAGPLLRYSWRRAAGRV